MRLKSRATKYVVLSGLLVAAIVSFSGCSAIGTPPEGERLSKVASSPNWNIDHFRDVQTRKEVDFLPVLIDWISADNPNATPDKELAVMDRKAADFVNLPETGLRITWLGHSTMLIEIDGYRVLMDPVWGERASPFSWIGPKRFHRPPLAFEDLPKLDAVVISHDHYDHLDHPTILKLAAAGTKFIMPLGVGSHFEYWGVGADQITELDWWQDIKVGDLTLTATPARHFSGRALTRRDKDKTLWAGWSLAGPKHRVYFSGDTAMFSGMTEIGERLGPFDVTMIETGAYNQRWMDVHLGPEQAVRAHRMVRGKLMIPVHWGTFELAMHSWTAPIERTALAAEKCGVDVATPRVGESVVPGTGQVFEHWWPQLPYLTAAQEPIVSSGYEGGAIC